MSARLLPPTATRVEAALEDVTRRLEDVPTPARHVRRADTCPEDVLPWEAWARGLRSWNPDWPLSVRRSMVRQAIPIARRMGSVASVKAVVNAFGGAVIVREWFQSDPPATPHTFEVVLNLNDVAGATPTAQFVSEVVAEIERVKPARSRFTFVQGLKATARLVARGAARPTVYRRIEFQTT